MSMSLEEFYTMISNPLEQDNIIDDILDVYSLFSNEFYDNLVCANNESTKKIVGKRNETYENALYTFMFGLWKARINSLASSKEYAKILQSYLADKKPLTKNQVLKVVTGCYTDDEKIKKVLSMLSFDRISSQQWQCCDSSIIIPDSHNRSITSHRLYINCDSTCVDLIAYEFMKKCIQRKLKFYFTFDKGSCSRNDTIVFYSDSERLITYMQILEEIKNEHNLDKHLHKPPLLTGKINDWIGYGSEPDLIERESYNSIRSKHLNNCIHGEIASFMRNNLDRQIVIHGRKMYYCDYLIDKIVNFVMSRCNISSVVFKKIITKAVRNRFNDILDYYENGTVFDGMCIDYKNRYIYIGKCDLDIVLETQLDLFRKSIPDFNDRLKARIKNTSADFGISENYAVDTYIEEVFKPKREAVTNASQHVVQSEDKPKVRRKFGII